MPPRPAIARGTGSQRTPRDANKSTGEEARGVAGQSSSLKLDTPPKSLPLSLSLSSGESGDNTSLGENSLNLSYASIPTDSDPSLEKSAERLYGKTTTGTSRSTLASQSRSSFPDKSPGLARAGSNRLTSSVSRLSPARRNANDVTRASDSKLDRTLSASSSHITAKASVTRTLSGPKSSLASADSASRARIVRRVMSGSRTNLSKKKSTSKTSLVVGRHNLYNRNKSGSKNSLLGSRNNLFRASLDSQKTESTTDSGCNSPLYGSQCSLDGDRKRQSSSPCPPSLRKQSGGSSSFISRMSRSDAKPKTKERSKSKENVKRESATPTRSPVRTPDTTTTPVAVTPEPETATAKTEPDSVDDDMGTDTGMGTSVEETKGCEADSTFPTVAGATVPKLQVKIVHAHTDNSASQLYENMGKPTTSFENINKPVTPIKRSCSLQLSRDSDPAAIRRRFYEMRAKSLSQSTCDGYLSDLGKENIIPLPEVGAGAGGGGGGGGISVSFRSVTSPVRRPSVNIIPNCIVSPENDERGSGSREKREVTKVVIVPEVKTKEEKGIQVEASSSEDEEEEEEEEEEELEENDEGAEEEREGVYSEASRDH
ncbi:uncharacterized protein LOC135213777 [Macrobrachium nipponense]|uniref:uncharacterized protein LOC135213777 n=1 Tax=Macrobrachium nipponense TaxID=159736 RepID=UPI0030C810AB